jgi:hypothetical protein
MPPGSLSLWWLSPGQQSTARCVVVITVDTNVLFALADRRDAHHARCRDWLVGCDEPLIAPPPNVI